MILALKVIDLKEQMVPIQDFAEIFYFSKIVLVIKLLLKLVKGKKIFFFLKIKFCIGIFRIFLDFFILYRNFFIF